MTGPTTMDQLKNSLSKSAQELHDKLVGLGLPEAQAVRSVKAQFESGTPLAPAVSPPTWCKAMLKVKEGADPEALAVALKAYAAASKASAGKVSASYTVSDGEVHFFETYLGPEVRECVLGLLTRCACAGD